VYLALQNGTVEAQENPLTTIEAKKFYEVQKYIALTGHIVDHLNTIISGQLWKKLSPEDRKIFSDVAQQAAERASQQIIVREQQLVEEFKKKGITVDTVNVADFRQTVLDKVPFKQYGYEKSDWEKIQAVK
jgi:TRAP-type C4-dicarboxylate transport system substrate-binding protein